MHIQPHGEAVHRALLALVSCPTASIGTVEEHAMGPVLEAFPIPIDGPVYHTGYHAEASFGATSYLIRRPEGNVLVRVRAGDARGRARVSISIFTRICTRGVKLVSKRSFRVKRP